MTVVLLQLVYFVTVLTSKYRVGFIKTVAIYKQHGDIKGKRNKKEECDTNASSTPRGKARGKKLLKRFPQYSGSLIYHWTKKPINSKILVNQRKFNTGRPRKLSAYDKWRVVRTVKHLRETMGDYTSIRVQIDSGTTHACNKTVKSYMNQNRYYYLRSRKKGVLTATDIKRCRKDYRKAKIMGLGGYF